MKKRKPVLKTISDDGTVTAYVDKDDLHRDRVRLFGRDLLGVDKIVKTGEIREKLLVEIKIKKKTKAGYEVDVFSHPTIYNQQTMKIRLGSMTGKMKEIKDHIIKEYKKYNVKFIKV